MNKKFLGLFILIIAVGFLSASDARLRHYVKKIIKSYQIPVKSVKIADGKEYGGGKRSLIITYTASSIEAREAQEVNKIYEIAYALNTKHNGRLDSVVLLALDKAGKKRAIVTCSMEDIKMYYLDQNHVKYSKSWKIKQFDKSFLKLIVILQSRK